MLKSLVKMLIVLVGMAWAGSACAVGFGTGTVHSALGQPLHVEISLLSVSEADRLSLSARLATPDNFKAVGLEYPYNLSKLKFEIAERGNRYFIVITSKDPVTDSFVNLLVELNWRSGKLMREFTFLLDPPNYQGDKPAPVEDVSTIPPSVATPLPKDAPKVEPLSDVTPPQAAAPSAGDTTPPSAMAASATVPEPSVGTGDAAGAGGEKLAGDASSKGAAGAQTTPAIPEEDAKSTAGAGKKSTGEREAVGRRQASQDTIVVKPGDTLSKIAKRVQEPDVTLEQMLVGLYRANVNQFEGRNMNRIRKGKILKMPEPEVLENLPQKEAVREITVQTRSWKAYKERLAAAVPPAIPPAPATQSGGGKINTHVADAQPKPVQEPGGKVVVSSGAGGGAAQNDAAAKKRQAMEDEIAQKKAAEEQQKRIAELDRIKQQANALQLQGTPPAPQPASGAAQPPAAASGTQVASGVRPLPKAAPPAAAAEEKSILDDIIDTIFENDTFKGLAADYPIIKDPMVLGGGVGGVLLLIGGGVFMLRRRGGGGRPQKKKIRLKK